MLGGYWAYSILGWGGYWGWDPVENSSLVPWIVGVASIHTLLVQKKAQEKGGIGRFVKMNLILSIMTYIMVLYSTFLTRSGILGDAQILVERFCAENVRGCLLPKVRINIFFGIASGKEAFVAAVKVDPRGRLERYEVRMLA